MATRIRLEFENNKVTYTKSLVSKAVEMLLKDEHYTVNMSKKQLVEWCMTHLHFDVKGRFNNGKIYAIKTDSAETVDIALRRGIGFCSPSDPSTPISEQELVEVFKQVLCKSTIVQLKHE